MVGGMPPSSPAASGIEELSAADYSEPGHFHMSDIRRRQLDRKQTRAEPVRKVFDSADVTSPQAKATASRAGSFAPILLDNIELDDDPVYLVDGILPAGPSFGETPAPPKALKSFFLMDMLMHVAMGKPYGGRTVQQGAVVYVTSEGVKGVKRRLIRHAETPRY
jgi:hypothetical protein